MTEPPIVGAGSTNELKRYVPLRDMSTTLRSSVPTIRSPFASESRRPPSVGASGGSVGAGRSRDSWGHAPSRSAPCPGVATHSGSAPVRLDGAPPATVTSAG